MANAEDVGAGLAELLRETERRRLRALVDRDLGTAEGLHADDYQLITPGGGAIDKRGYLDGVASGELDYIVFEPASEIAVRLLGVSAAALRYQARIEMDLGDRVDSDRFWHTDMYELRDGRWQATWSQATRIRR